MGTFAIWMALEACLLFPIMESFAETGQKLVVEVVEEIPADAMVELEDNEVPLAMGPAERHLPVIPVIYMSTAVILLAAYELIGHRRRNALFRIRRDGYREEAARQKERS